MNIEDMLSAGEDIIRLGLRIENGDTVIQSETKLEGLLMAAGVAIGIGALAYTQIKRTARTRSKR